MTLPIVPRFDTAKDLTRNPKPIDWLVDGMIPSGLFGILFGEPYAGKSLLALAWSCAIASGKGWLGRKAKPGVVFYIAGEGQSGIGRRVSAWCDANGVSPDEIKLYVSQRGTNLLDPKELGELRRKIQSVYDEGEDVRLIVIDTKTRAAPGMNEDRAEEVMQFVAACNALQTEYFDEPPSVLVLDHTGHHDKTRAKGSISMKGACDFEFGILRTSTDSIVKLTCTKMKDGDRPADQFLRLKPVSMSMVLVDCEEPPARSGKAPRFKLRANDVLFAKALGDGQDAAAVRAAFIAAHPTGQGDAAQNYLRAKKRALTRGWFVEGEDHMLTPNAQAMERDGVADT